MTKSVSHLHSALGYLFPREYRRQRASFILATKAVRRWRVKISRKISKSEWFVLLGSLDWQKSDEAIRSEVDGAVCSLTLRNIVIMKRVHML
ncbi:MAG: hypothetical protein MORG_02346 [Morganella sp. (in: enterobacteria)]